MVQEVKLPKVEVKALLEAGAHFGHRKRRWNPKMAPYIYGSKGDVHILNLDKTKRLLELALHAVADVVKSNGRILFVGTKKQASGIVAEKAKESGQFYVNNRWLGGMLTNNLTVSNSIKTMESIEKTLSDKDVKLTKKEKLSLSRKLDKLYLSLNGVRDMKALPDMMIVIDTNKELIALKEAAKLNIPVVAIVDTNSTLENVRYPIPANDDSIKSLSTICSYIAEAINIAKPTVQNQKLVKEDLTKGRISDSDDKATSEAKSLDLKAEKPKKAVSKAEAKPAAKKAEVKKKEEGDVVEKAKKPTAKPKVTKAKKSDDGETK